MSRWVSIAINAAAFNVLWTLSMFGVGKPWWWAAPILIMVSLVIQLRFSPSPWREAVLILGGACVGAGLDVLGTTLGPLRSTCGSRAEFVVLFFAMWVNFGTTLRPSLSWMWTRPALATVLGAVGGPCAYWVGSRIGGISLGETPWQGLAWASVQYAVAVPVWMRAAAQIMGSGGGKGRLRNSPGATR